MSYSTLYLQWLVGEQQIFAEYMLIKNNVCGEVENRTLKSLFVECN